MKKISVSFRIANLEDHPRLEKLRQDAFAPIFASFRKILGDKIYEVAQRKEDEQQHEILTEMFSKNSKWELYAAEYDDAIVGFVSFWNDCDTKVGEIGLNAVDPSRSGLGIGTQMYDFAITQMKSTGMKAAVVATGGDESHAPARRAYEKSGFNVQIPSVWMCQEL